MKYSLETQSHIRIELSLDPVISIFFRSGLTSKHKTISV